VEEEHKERETTRQQSLPIHNSGAMKMRERSESRQAVRMLPHLDRSKLKVES
jgi:hypothetical protein